MSTLLFILGFSSIFSLGTQSKNAMVLNTLLALSFILITPLSFAFEPNTIEINASQKVQSTGDNYLYLTDASNSLSLEQVITSSQWRIPEANITNRGFTSASSWMKFAIQNSGDTDLNLILEYVEASVDRIDLYHRVKGSAADFEHASFSFTDAVAMREISFFRPAFQLPLPKNETKEVYVKIFPGNQIPMHSFTAMKIWDESSFYYSTHIELSFMVILLCTELLMGIATLLVFFVSKDRMFLYYSIFAFSIASLFASLSGIWGYFFYKEGYQLWMIVLQISICQVAAIWFVRSFLNIRRLSITIDNLLLMALAISIAGVLTNLAGYHYYPRLIIDNIAFLYILLLPIGLYAWKKKVPHAGLFTFSWAVFIFGMLTASLRLRGYLNDSYGVQWLIYIGGFIEAFLLTTVMLLRLKDIQYTKQQIEQKHRQHLQNYADELALQVQLQTKQLSDAKDEAESEARVDFLTGIYNRRAFIESANRFLARVNRNQDAGLHFLMIDIDYFKYVNDTYGHAAGDAVLIAVADAISATVRTVDVVSRLGGEEFGILMENNEPQDTITLAERIRSAIESLNIEFQDHRITITASIGVAKWQSGMDLDSLMNQSDRLLYQAKESGRNNVVNNFYENHRLTLS